jgi:hypothetical protein
MTLRQFAGLALVGGAWLGLGGEAARAQSTSARFVQMLLVRENQQIHQNSLLIATQNRDVRNISILEASSATPRTQRLLASLERTVNQLQSRINRVTTSLVQLSGQTSEAAFLLSPPNARFSALAASNMATITTFADRPPFGIPPVTSSQ